MLKSLLNIFKKIIADNKHNSASIQITPKEQRAIYSKTDFNAYFDTLSPNGYGLKIIQIGEIRATTNKIVVCDPLACPDSSPLMKEIPLGLHKIEIAIKEDDSFGKRIAFAKLSFNRKNAKKWELALKNNDDTSTLEDDDYFGFPVDAAMAGFYDLAAQSDYLKFLNEFYDLNPNKNIYADLFDAEFNNGESDGLWINYRLPNSETDIIMFTSGLGDGVYPSFWGLTDDDEIASLVIDFLLFEDSESPEL